MRVVISQPMYFPWVGMLEQIRLADVFIHYSDVQFVRGFINRVQVKTAHGVRWMTVPIRHLHQGRLICELEIDEGSGWRSRHRDILRQAYSSAPRCDEMLGIFDEVLESSGSSLAGLSIASLEALASFFGLSGTRFLDSRDLDVPGRRSQRLRDLVRSVGGTEYITGHGALRYLDHKLFVDAGIEVHVMDYRRTPYPQPHGAFTPHVSALDLAANCGREGRSVIHSPAVNWDLFVPSAE